MTLSFGGGAGVLTIPGLISDGADGVVIAGKVTAGDSAATNVPTFHQINGQLYLPGSPGNDVDGDDLLTVTQFSPLGADSSAAAANFARGGALNGHQYTTPTLVVHDGSSSTAPLADFSSGAMGGGRVRIGQQGGVGMFSAAAPTAPRTLAQATITAITDANAKAAVQACANALADMGVLTLT